MNTEGLRDRLREALARSGMSRREVSRKAGLSESVLGAFLRGDFGRKGFNVSTLEEIASALDVSPGWLAFGEAAAGSTKPASPADPAPIPLILTCIACHARHVDKGRFATQPHRDHSCQACGVTWRPALVPTVGVQFLPGYKDEPEVDHA